MIRFQSLIPDTKYQLIIPPLSLLVFHSKTISNHQNFYGVEIEKMKASEVQKNEGNDADTLTLNHPPM